MSKAKEFLESQKFRGAVYGFFAAFVLIFVVSAVTNDSVTFTASSAVSLKPVPKCDSCKPEPLPPPVVIPKKKKDCDDGDVGKVGATK